MIRTIGTLMTAGNSGAIVGANGYYRSITLDQPASDLSDFPVLFYGTYTYLKTEANSGKVHNSNGYDIVFYSDAALTTKLKFERVFWSATTGDVEFWVNIPTLTSASATVIYLAYGNITISTDQQDAAGTWNTNYKSVYHLPDGTTLTANDSTGSHNGTISGASAIAGKIDGAANFNGTSDFISATSPFNIQQTTPFTISAWIKTDETVNLMTIMADWNISVSAGWEFTISEFLAGKIDLVLSNLGGTSYFGRRGSTTVTGNTDFYVVATFSGNSANTGINIYVNGVLETMTNLSLGLANPGTLANTDFRIGSRKLSGAGNQFYEDVIDEVRIKDNEDTATWVATEYSNQNDPANFYSIGTETPA